MQLEAAADQVAKRIRALPPAARRRLIALAGPPASGKSTLAEQLSEILPNASVVPMDGFHLDNRILEKRGLLSRKGAADTFDVAGFSHLMRRLREEDEVIYPLFDRSIEKAVAGAGCVSADIKTVLVEGNYLLLDAPGWRELAGIWDYSVYLSVPEDVLRERLMSRWAHYGYPIEVAQQKVDQNDLPNAKNTAEQLLPPDMLIEETA